MLGHRPASPLRAIVASRPVEEERSHVRGDYATAEKFDWGIDEDVTNSASAAPRRHDEEASTSAATADSEKK